jgi:parallel beta-helix repeat protein
MLTLLLASILTLAFDIQLVKASGTIYIRADGSVDPPETPIHRNGDVYTLTDTITSDTDGIIIERSNIVLDGAAHKIQGPRVGDTKGISLYGKTNVVIQNIEITAFNTGIYLDGSYGNTISGNNVTNNGNYVGNVPSGIFMRGSHDNIISINNIADNIFEGIHVRDDSYGNIIYGNNITGHEWAAVYLASDSNRIIENNVTDNAIGITLQFTSGNTISRNRIAKNNKGIHLLASLVSISENELSENNYAIYFDEHGSGGDTIYHNNFVNNNQQVPLDSVSYNVQWDDGYPSGGNYWSDYNGKDLFRGPYQNETGSDGIGDTPYVIDADNQDNYPLMNPWGVSPPLGPSVGGEWAPISTVQILTPWIALVFLSIAFATAGSHRLLKKHV